MTGFLAILILVLIAAIIISIFLGAVAFVIRFAVPILIIALAIWLYQKHKKENSNGGSTNAGQSTETFAGQNTDDSSTRKEARDVSTSDVKDDNED